MQIVHVLFEFMSPSDLSETWKCQCVSHCFVFAHEKSFGAVVFFNEKFYESVDFVV